MWLGNIEIILTHVFVLACVLLRPRCRGYFRCAFCFCFLVSYLESVQTVVLCCVGPGSSVALA
jgi:hypothetical protein